MVIVLSKFIKKFKNFMKTCVSLDFSTVSKENIFNQKNYFEESFW